jgi:hypothetical protein
MDYEAIPYSISNIEKIIRNLFFCCLYGNAFVHGVQKEFRDNTTSANHDITATPPTQLSQNHSRTLPNVWHRQLPYNNAIKELFR